MLKALEEARTKGIIGHSLDAKVAIGPQPRWRNRIREFGESDMSRLQDLLIVSQVLLTDQTGDVTTSMVSSYTAPLGYTITVSKADGGKCERCWKYDVQVGADKGHPTVCARCAAVLGAGASA